MTYRFLIPVLAVAILAIPLTAQDVEDRYWFRFPPGLFEHDPLLFDDTLELHDIETRGENLYVAGQITHVNGAFVGSLALYNGYDRSWHDLDSGVGYAPMLNPRASDIAVTADGTLYVGDGHYAEAGGPRTPSDPGGTLIGTDQMARFLGGVWSAISKPEARYDMVVADDGRLYALGFNLMRWNGAAWELIAAGINHAYSAHTQNTWPAVATGGGGIYFRTRLFDTLGRSAVHIRRWDLATGTMSTLPGRGLSGAGEFKMQALAVGTEGEIYVGGLFTTAGERTVRNIARYNPTDSSWSTLGQGLDGEVRALAIGPSGELYAGGAFTMAGDQPVNHIAMWNGSRWIGLGAGVDGPVHDLAFDALGRLYVIGTFLQAGGAASHYLARWDKEGEVTRPPLVVNTLEDKGDGSCDSVHCSLRDAIEEANRNRNRDTIYFDLKQKGRRVYMPDSALPYLTQPVLIDGRRDSGVQVVIDGSKIPGGSPGIVLSGGNSVLRGLSIVRMFGDGVRLVEKDGNVIEGCFIGTDSDTTEGLGNSWNGVYISSSSGNRIGYGFGLDLYDSANVITDNGYSGVFVESGERNALNGNIIFDNKDLGIDLAPIGVNANDSADLDSGPNTLLNYPLIDSGVTKSGRLTVYGRMLGRRGETYVFSIYVTDTSDPTGYGEGRTVVGSSAATADEMGVARFSTSITALRPNQSVCAIAHTLEGNTSEFSRCWPKRLRAVDAHGTPLAKRTLALWKVRQIGANLESTLIDSVETNDSGDIVITTFGTGDTVRLGRRVHTVASLKHSTPANALMIELDNGEIDSLSFRMRYDTVDTAYVQRITLDHTELRINLVVSIEWDARPDYAVDLQRGFRLLGNYLYDVFDGQIRIDTVAIATDKRRWRQADIAIYASNILRGHAKVGGLTQAVAEVDSLSRINWERRNFYSRRISPITLSTTEYPYQVSASENYRGIGHELGHYALGFFDEYVEELEGSTSACPGIRNVGYMQDYFDVFSSGEEASEMSWSIQYCRNTDQFEWNGMACWEYFEKVYEKEYDGLFVPIVTPAERHRPPGVKYFLGPNNGSTPEIDVGRLTVFSTLVVASNASDPLFIARKPGGGFVTNVFVGSRTRRGDSIYSIFQGRNTADSGIARIMGVRPGDSVWAAGAGPMTPHAGKSVAGSAPTPAWWYGTCVFGENGTSTIGTSYTTGADGLSLTMRSADISPFLCVADAAVDDEISLTLIDPDNVLDDPVLESDVEDRTVSTSFVRAGDLLRGEITAGAGTESVGLLWSGSDAERFFVPIAYAVRRVSGAVELASADGYVHFEIDSADEAATALLVSSPFPVPTAGIDTNLLPIGSSHSIALSGEEGSDSRGLRATIFYEEASLISSSGTMLSEGSLTVYRWEESAGEWRAIEGIVDSAQDRVVVPSTSAGTFILAAGFTKPNYPTDGRSVELGLLHPNPFVDRAEIPLLLDKPAHVTVTVHDLLGRELAVIADREFFAGESTLEWDGTNNEGGRLPGGVYFIVAKIDGEHAATQGISIQVE